jgi:hypothetical protein
LASKVRELAARTRLPYARRELIRVAESYERRGDHLDQRACYWPTIGSARQGSSSILSK